jgi:hypothetical protein
MQNVKSTGLNFNRINSKMPVVHSQQGAAVEQLQTADGMKCQTTL